MYEIHIAFPVLPVSTTSLIFAALEEVGIKKNKFFYAVENIRPADSACHPAGTPPTGHDLENPGSMSTVKVPTYAEARALILTGMEVLAKHSVEGNFEIEALIGPSVPEFPEIDVDADFTEFQRVPDSPAFENHIIWKNLLGALPSYDQIVAYFEAELGTTPHQIVDFGRDAVCSEHTIVSRVATVYQPSHLAAIEFASKLRGARNTMGHRYAVAEQVLLVGEPKH